MLQVAFPHRGVVPLQILAPKSASSLQRLQSCIPHSSECVQSLLLFLWFVIFKAQYTLTPSQASSHVLLSWVSWQTLSKDICSPRTRPGGQTKYASGSGQNINSGGNICYVIQKRGEPVSPREKLASNYSGTGRKWNNFLFQWCRF